MEEIIRLSRYEMEFGQIKRKGIYLIFLILFMVGLYGMAERYREGIIKSGREADVQKQPVVSNLTEEVNPREENILAVEEAVSLTNGMGRIDWWKEPERIVSAQKIRTTNPVPVSEAVVGSSAILEPSQTGEISADEATPEQEIGPVQVTINLHGNGGEPSISTVMQTAGVESTEGWRIPFRPGKVFDGWYLDAGCTVPFGGVEDGISILEVYAGWKEFDGFVSNDAGHIVSCTATGVITDGILALPADAACTGIEAGALATVAEQITEIYIPANISYVGAGSFDGLPNLMYIEAAGGNPSYYSEGGVLYNSAGEVVAAPVWYEE